MTVDDRTRTTAPPISIVGWAMLIMLVMASVLFFIDRQSLAILKSTISWRNSP